MCTADRKAGRTAGALVAGHGQWTCPMDYPVRRFPHQLKDVKKAWALQNCPRTAESQLFGVQAGKKYSPQLYELPPSDGGSHRGKEGDVKVLMEEHRESLLLLKAFLEVAGEIV